MVSVGVSPEMDSIEFTSRRVKARASFEGFYRWASAHCLNEEELRKHHYPRPHPSIPGKAVIYNVPHKYFRSVSSPNTRLCRFCFKRYTVDENGDEIGVNTCFYHPFRRPPPSVTYPCCGRHRMGSPCCKRNFHCTEDIDVDKLDDFVCTANSKNQAQAIYALDCEFVQMKSGLALAQIIIVDHKENLVMDSIVFPPEPIVDYLPQFSNLSEESFTENCLTIEEFQVEMDKLLGPNVILIGHSLHCDLLKMKVIHDKILDSARLFKHPDGPEYCLSLKSLVQKHLVQDSLPNAADIPKPHLDSVMSYRLVKKYALGDKKFSSYMQ